MFDAALLTERLAVILTALERISRRFASIKNPEDFIANDDGIDRMDAICMMLIAVGEEIKSLDRQTGGEWLSRYPAVDWQGVKGVRNVLAHGYFDVDHEALFAICRNDIPQLIEMVRLMIADAKKGIV